MASLYFYYSTMNSGKTSHLLQANYNYHERGMTTILFNAAINDREGSNRNITSRIGISAPATAFNSDTCFFSSTEQALSKGEQINCILIDEAQFLTECQVRELGRIVDELNVPVMAYGLRTDYKGQLFEGSKTLLAIADHLLEIKGICFCGKKSTMAARINSNGNAALNGTQILIGGEDKYIALCRKHHSSALRGELVFGHEGDRLLVNI